MVGEGSCQEGQIASVFIIAVVAITTIAIKQCLLQASHYVGGFAWSV